MPPTDSDGVRRAHGTDRARGTIPWSAVAWSAVGSLVLLPAVPVSGSPVAAALLAWQPDLVATQPWRAWSAAWVHLSRLHLLANLAGGVLVIALGLAAALPPRAALAWALAWPLTHIGLLAVPALQRYGGASGVLHAGVAVVAVMLVQRAGRAERRLGWAIATVLLIKLASETPWRGPLAHPAGWDIAIAPIAHVAGAVAGLAGVAGVAAGALLGRLSTRRRARAIRGAPSDRR